MALLHMNKWMLGLIGVAIAGALWYALSPSGSAPLLSSQPAGPGQDVVDTLRELDAVNLDPAIFANPSFATLKDFSTAIVPEPVGRPNPFAPLTPAARPTASSTSAAKIFAPHARTGGPQR